MSNVVQIGTDIWVDADKEVDKIVSSFSLAGDWEVIFTDGDCVISDWSPVQILDALGQCGILCEDDDE